MATKTLPKKHLQKSGDRINKLSDEEKDAAYYSDHSCSRQDDLSTIWQLARFLENSSEERRRRVRFAISDLIREDPDHAREEARQDFDDVMAAKREPAATMPTATITQREYEELEELSFTLNSVWAVTDALNRDLESNYFAALIRPIDNHLTDLITKFGSRLDAMKAEGGAA